MGCGDDLGAATGPAEVAAEDGVQGLRPQPPGLSGRLTLAQGRQRHIQMSDESARLGPQDRAVTQQVDQRGPCVHATNVSNAASSPSSTPAPSTSPVIPPRRTLKNHPAPRAARRATARASSPTHPDTTPAIVAAPTRAAHTSQVLSPALKSAPCPEARAGGKHRPRMAGVARPIAG